MTWRHKEPEGESTEPINMLFNSTLNIEFVYVILEGIVKFSQMGLGEISPMSFDTEFEQDITYSKDK